MVTFAGFLSVGGQDELIVALVSSSRYYFEKNTVLIHFEVKDS